MKKLIALGIVGALLAVFLYADFSSSHDSNGCLPSYMPLCIKAWDRYSLPANPDETIAYGNLYLENAGHTKIVLQNATLVNSTGGFTVQPWVTSEQTYSGASANVSPSFFSRFQPLSGATVLPHPGKEGRPGLVLVWQIHVDQAGYLGWDKVDLTYMVDGASQEVILPQAVRICSPGTAFQSCELGGPTSL